MTLDLALNVRRIINPLPPRFTTASPRDQKKVHRADPREATDSGVLSEITFLALSRLMPSKTSGFREMD